MTCLETKLRSTDAKPDAHTTSFANSRELTHAVYGLHKEITRQLVLFVAVPVTLLATVNICTQIRKSSC